MPLVERPPSFQTKRAISAIGTSRHFAAPQNLGTIGVTANIDPLATEVDGLFRHPVAANSTPANFAVATCRDRSRLYAEHIESSDRNPFRHKRIPKTGISRG
jgi:hypothetical protein